jgi:hypothetical protein
MFVERKRVLVHINKKATRQQFYGMLTGSVIFDSVKTDNRLVLFSKHTVSLSLEQILLTSSAGIFLIKSFKFRRR